MFSLYIFHLGFFASLWITNYTAKIVTEFQNYLQLESYVLFSAILKATRITNTYTSLIDSIWTSKSETKVRSGIIFRDISHLYPTFCSFILNLSAYHKPQVPTYKKELSTKRVEVISSKN